MSFKLKELLLEKGYIRGPFGSALRRKEMLEEGVPVYEQKNAIDNHREFRYFISQEKHEKLKRFTVKENDLIISCSGTVGKVSIIKDNDPKGIISQALLILRPNTKKILPKYLYYYFASPEGYNSIINRSSGSVQVNIAKRGIIENIDLRVPEIKEQKSVVNILSVLDEKIENNNQINKNLEEMAQAIFKHWFVDFEFPNEEGEPYKSSGGKMVESELGMIPEGWEVKEIGDISKIQNGFAFRAKEYTENGIKVLRTLNIGSDGYFNNDDIVFLPHTYDNQKYQKYMFKKFDVALVMVGASIGKIGMILDNTSNSLQNQNMWRFRTKNEKLLPQLFLYYLVKEAQKIGSNWKTGSAREFYRKDSFKKIKVIIPDKKNIEKFKLISTSMFKKISKLVSENDNLISLRDNLLPKLMSGEIRVPINGGDVNE
jgi:type I restriction enzyme S subunit